jgi:hypothetical protein
MAEEPEKQKNKRKRRYIAALHNSSPLAKNQSGRWYKAHKEGQHETTSESFVVKATS